jgi:hypothetical protein
VSPDLENKLSGRIRVREGSEWVAVAPETPTLSSAQSPWGGALLERYAHGPYTTNTHRHLSHFVSLHLGDPAPFVWRSQGKQGHKIIEHGSIIVVSRGTEDWVSFAKPVKRIVLNLEPEIFRQAFFENDTALFAHSKLNSKLVFPEASSSQNPYSGRSLYVFNKIMV